MEEKVEEYLKFRINEAVDTIPWDAKDEKIKEEYKKKLTEIVFDSKDEERCKKGYQLILENLEGDANEIPCKKELSGISFHIMAAAERILGPNLDKVIELWKEGDFKKMQEIIGEKKGVRTKSLAEMWGLTPKALDVFYNIGFHLYNSPDVEDAISVFTFLSMIDEYNDSVWVCKGMSHQKAEEWDEAKRAFLIASALNEDNKHYLENCKQPFDKKESVPI